LAVCGLPARERGRAIPIGFVRIGKAEVGGYGISQD